MRARGILAAAFLAGLLPSVPARAESATAFEPAPGRIVSADLLADLKGELGAERETASAGLWIWSLVTVGAGSYAVWSVTGHHEPSAVVQYLSFITVLGGLSGAYRSARRDRQLGGLLDAVARDEAAGGPPVRLSAATESGVDRELTALHASLAGRAGGALRAGCVVPALLGGIGLYGLAVKSPAGDDLAGLALGGALVIGGPSVLSYWGLRDRLSRIDRLLQRWNEADASHGPAAP